MGHVGCVWATHFAQSSGYSPTGPGGTDSGGVTSAGSTSGPGTYGSCAPAAAGSASTKTSVSRAKRIRRIPNPHRQNTRAI